MRVHACNALGDWAIRTETREEFIHVFVELGFHEEGVASYYDSRIMRHPEWRSFGFKQYSVWVEGRLRDGDIITSIQRDAACPPRILEKDAKRILMRCTSYGRWLDEVE